MRKGGEVLLEAFEIVRRAVPEARLQIVGTQLPGLERAPDGVDALGLVRDRGRIADLYRNASVFCLPSLFDPSPLVVLEAMAWGLPCVLSRDASQHVRHVIERDAAGRIAETGDAAGLATAIIDYLHDPDAARVAGARARRAVLAGYQWADVVDRMAPAIESVLNSSSAPRLTTP